MTTHTRCAICKNSDLRRILELGWNAKMTVADLAHAMGGVPSHAAIYKHLKEHADGAYARQIEVEDARPMRERVMAIQRSQIEAIERNLAMAQQKADDYAENHRGDDDFDPFMADPSFYFNVLGKDFQSAVSSILKAQGLTDKREATATEAKVDLYRLMIGERGGLAPAGLIDDGIIEGDATEVSTDGDA